MGKWFNQAAEIESLREEVRRQARIIESLRRKAETGEGSTMTYSATAEERAAKAAGRRIEAIKMYRERTGCDLATAKNAIDLA